jgi:hypothetical protein
MNAQLLHLSYKRVDNETSWDGYGVNEQMLEEFKTMWQLLLDSLDDRFTDEFKERYAAHSDQPEYRRFSTD